MNHTILREKIDSLRWRRGMTGRRQTDTTTQTVLVNLTRDELASDEWERILTRRLLDHMASTMEAALIERREAYAS